MASEARAEYTVRVLYQLPEASPDAGSLAQVYTAIVPARLAESLRASQQTAGREIDDASAAAQVVYELGNRDPDQLAAVRTHLTRLPYAMAERAPSPGDVFLVGGPDGQVTAVQATVRGWNQLGEPPPFLPLEPGAGEPPPLAPPHDYRVRVLHPVPSQAVQGMTMRADDFDHVATLDVPAEPVQAAVDREIAFGEPPFPAAQAAEIVFKVGNHEPGDLTGPLAALAADYRNAELRSLSVGDVLLVDAPDGTSTALLCDTIGWRELEEAPTFGPPGHNPSIFRDQHQARFCLRVTTWQASDVVLGSGAYGEGLDASRLLPSHKGVGVLRGMTDSGQTVRTYLADQDDADGILARARVLRDNAGTLTGAAAGKAPDPGPAVNVLDEVLAVVPASEAKVWSETVIERLVDLRPRAYEGWGPEQLAAALKPHGITTKQVWDTTRDGKGANRRGVERAALVTARDRRPDPRRPAG